MQDIPARPDERIGEDDWTGARYRWDTRAAHLLLHRAGGGDRTPFFHRDGRPMSRPGADGPVALSEQVLMLQDAGRITQAWRAAGVQVDDAFGEPEMPIYGNAEPGPEALRAAVPALATAAPALQDGVPEVTLEAPRPWWYRTGVFLSIVDGQLRAERRRTPSDPPVGRVPVPSVGWERLADVELLRTGLITAEELHPLVRAALFPEQPDPGYRPDCPQWTTPIFGCAAMACGTASAGLPGTSRRATTRPRSWRASGSCVGSVAVHGGAPASPTSGSVTPAAGRHAGYATCAPTR